MHKAKGKTNSISSFIQGGDEFQKLEFIDRAIKETYWDI